jgi:BlaI family transcriptional regulator, penicillinase repressor
MSRIPEASMARTPQDVTEAELAVLRALWQQGPASVRQLTERLYPRGGSAQLATVQKLLERLEAKECVRRDRSGSVQLFGAAIGRDDLIGRRLQGIAEQLCDGSLTPLLSHLVQTDRLSEQERQSLRDLIDELDRPRPRSKKS